MIDLTPLDIRKKKGDFRKGMRGYDPQEVDHFLELAAERLEAVVRENMMLWERAERLGSQVEGQEARERAVQEALVTAQALREEIEGQARREGELIRREAEGAASAIRERAERLLHENRRELEELHRARLRFLHGFRKLLERELDRVDQEETSPPELGFDLEAMAEGSGVGDEGDGRATETAEPASADAEEARPW